MCLSLTFLDFNRPQTAVWQPGAVVSRPCKVCGCKTPSSMRLTNKVPKPQFCYLVPQKLCYFNEESHIVFGKYVDVLEKPVGMGHFTFGWIHFGYRKSRHCALLLITYLLPAEHHVSWHFAIHTNPFFRQESVYLEKLSTEPVGSLTTPVGLLLPWRNLAFQGSSIKHSRISLHPGLSLISTVSITVLEIQSWTHSVLTGRELFSCCRVACSLLQRDPFLTSFQLLLQLLSFGLNLILFFRCSYRCVFPVDQMVLSF